ncbi:cytochrome b561 domain-containing protein 1 isoform X2 [Pygocentrus nattereri]|uniref:cytochrome b561 domain-containing protein 1 isoform X2 n=1 Tax=Pygocentrus nattereri TaxID=42514 RepID=UPI001891C790|nr:cytochrome b561 domain-containing protein 1 isoform X2 [Pygocentrus nattereri]
MWSTARSGRDWACASTGCTRACARWPSWARTRSRLASPCSCPRWQDPGRFCLCMTEGILLFSADGSPFCFKSRKGKIRVHWILQALMLLAAATGLGFMVASKNVSARPHLASWHSILGVATLVATALQAACGVCLLFPKLLGISSMPRLRLYHATCGLVAYLLATITVVAAMFTDWFQAAVKGATWYGFLLLPLFPALVVMNQITNSFLPKKKLTT